MVLLGAEVKPKVRLESEVTERVRSRVILYQSSGTRLEKNQRLDWGYVKGHREDRIVRSPGKVRVKM